MHDEKQVRRVTASVAVITYNQEAYLVETLDSILAQECTFDFEIVIGEDCSTDGTRQICRDYQQKYPQVIRLLLQDKNQGLVENYYQTFGLCRGDYIAQCAGDDYWCDRQKLQKQVDFLEQNRDYALVCGGIRIHAPEKGADQDVLPQDWSSRAFDMLINRENIPPAPTICFRRSMFEKAALADIRAQHFMLEDLPLLLALLQQGKFYAIPEILAVYRVCPGSISWPRQVEKKIAFEKSVCEVVIFCARKYRYGGAAFRRRVRNRCHEKCLKLLIGAGNYAAALRYLGEIPRADFFTWKVFRSYLAARIPFLRRFLFKRIG